MSSTHESTTLTVRIDRPPRDVFNYVRNPENLPRWATSFCRSAHRLAGEWMIDTISGPAMIRFLADNPLGVLDHLLRTAAGEEIYVPMRVIANGSGSEVIFTLFRLPGMSDEKFAADAEMVRKDLQNLKAELERPESSAA